MAFSCSAGYPSLAKMARAFCAEGVAKWRAKWCKDGVLNSGAHSTCLFCQPRRPQPPIGFIPGLASQPSLGNFLSCRGSYPWIFYAKILLTIVYGVFRILCAFFDVSNDAHFRAFIRIYSTFFQPIFSFCFFGTFFSRFPQLFAFLTIFAFFLAFFFNQFFF